MAATMIIEGRSVVREFATPWGKVPVIRGVDVEVRQGEILAITGPSGAGKSTLLHLLGMLERPTAGTILYRGRETGGIPAGELDRIRGRRVGFVFQMYHLLPDLSAVENVALPAMISGDAAAGRERATRLLERFGLGERCRHRPRELSGGERQRVAIARALVNEPEVVLCDEPTGNLDSAMGEEILALLAEMNREDGRAFVIVTHDDSVARVAHRSLKMVDGRIVGSDNADPAPAGEG